MVKSDTQLKTPEAYGRMIKKYGPGFVAMSTETGKVLAHGKDINEVFEKVKDTPLFKEQKIRISHVPPSGKLLY